MTKSKIKINQSYQQKCPNDLISKLKTTRIKPRTLEQLVYKIPKINSCKDRISDMVQFYLDERENFGVELDINRKCRALGIPAYFSSMNIRTPELDIFENNIYKDLTEHAMNDDDGQIEYVCMSDIEECYTYGKLYQEVRLISEFSSKAYNRLQISKHLHANTFGRLNPFSDIMDLMDVGAVITRFKYVKYDGCLPVEKLITYHLGEDSKLYVHIEGHKEFMGYKYWGDGDEKIINSPQYSLTTKIRWGEHDFDKVGEFLY